MRWFKVIYKREIITCTNIKCSISNNVVYLITRLVFLMIGLIITTLVRLRGTNMVIIENRYSILVILISITLSIVLSSMSG
jgi:hypothetical protein